MVVAFTWIACATWAVAEFGGCARLRGVGRLLVVFTAASFQAAGALDARCFARQRRRNGWSVAVFYAGHAVVHLLPAAHALLGAPPAPVGAGEARRLGAACRAALHEALKQLMLFLQAAHMGQLLVTHDVLVGGLGTITSAMDLQKLWPHRTLLAPPKPKDS